MNQEMMPTRVLKMMLELHQRGYQSLYLYSGLSPSGMYWRYEIGIAKKGRWPVKLTLTSGSCDRESLGADWAKNYLSAQELADSFVNYFGSKLEAALTKNPEYISWFKSVVDSLNADELLVFYEDIDEARHEKLLVDAPGYIPFYYKDLM